MSEFVTLQKSDPSFEAYLTGTFSRDKRALPIASLNVSRDSEQVTFELIDIQKIKIPNVVVKWSHILKARNFILVALPMFTILTKLFEANEFRDPVTAIFATIGAFLLLAAMNLRNDFNDHMRGLDRMIPNSGSRAIQNGWVTAQQVRSLSNWLLAFSVVFGLPSLVKYPVIILLVVVPCLLVFMILNASAVGLKYRRWTEFAVFLMFGPFVTVGYQTAAGGGLDWEILVLGIVTGWFAVFTLHLKNFEQLLEGSQAQFDNSVTKAGFENGKKLLLAWWLIFLVLFDFYHFFFTAHYWAWFLALASLGCSLGFVTSVLNLRSPLGSGMERTIFQGRAMYLFILSLWFIENAFYLLKREFFS